MARSVTGWRAKYIMDRPKITSATPPTPTPEQKAASRALMESQLRKMAIDGGVPDDQIEAWVAEKAA